MKLKIKVVFRHFASTLKCGKLNKVILLCCLHFVLFFGTAFIWTTAATACSNVISDSSCAVLYPAPVPADGYPSSGKDQQRPLACFTTATATPAAVIQDMKTAAQSTCPKNCGLCCQTSAYNCPNVAFPRLNCASITASQCQSPAWRTIITTDCPSACGFCNQGGCVDAVPECANDKSICNTVGLQDFVNTYCQKSCGRCASPTRTTRSSGIPSTCTSYMRDSSSACIAWARNGFCTNNFYTIAHRKQYCASTCRIC